ncbi:PAS domain S-box protein, partial [bacterium]|nr:PAS domain S-box protein [bacterium]
MIFFDIRTIVFSYVVTNIICVLFIVLLWRQSRDRFAGLDLLAFDFILQTVALVLIVLRGAIPDWMSIVLSNTMIITGALLGFLGYEHFVGKKGPQTHNYVLVTFFILVQCYFFFVQPSLTVRSLNISLTLLLICFQSVWLMWHRIEPGLRSLTFGVGLVNFLYCLDSIFRIIKLSIGTYTENNYFQSGTFEALALIVYQLLFIMLTYSIIMMVNRRLLMEIGTQEEKFSKAFHSVPYAIMLTRLSDGLMFEVNDGFANITGYHYDDAMGKTTIDLRLWVNEEDRIAIVSELTRHKRVRDAEYQFRKKSGEIVFG